MCTKTLRIGVNFFNLKISLKTNKKICQELPHSRTGNAFTHFERAVGMINTVVVAQDKVKTAQQDCNRSEMGKDSEAPTRWKLADKRNGRLRSPSPC